MTGNREPKAGRFVAVAAFVALTLVFAAGCGGSDSGDADRGDGAPTAESPSGDWTDGETGDAGGGTAAGDRNGTLDIDGESAAIAPIDTTQCVIHDDFAAVNRWETSDGTAVTVNGGIKIWTGRVITDTETWVAAYDDPAIASDATIDLVEGHLVLEGTWVSETGGDDTAQIRLEVTCPQP